MSTRLEHVQQQMAFKETEKVNLDQSRPIGMPATEILSTYDE